MAGNLSHLANWTRPDGVKVWAIWTPAHNTQAKLDIKGKLAEAQNHMGEKQTVNPASQSVGPSTLYLVGPDSVTLR